MPLYFAYGWNMDAAGMARRCPNSRPLGPARLPRHRFFVMREGFASIVRDPRRTVHGVLWELALSDVAALDRFESLHTGLYAKVTQSVIASEGPRRAIVYLGRQAEPGAAKPGYMEDVVAAARAAGLPASYVAELETHLPVRKGPPPARAPMGAAR